MDAEKPDARPQDDLFQHVNGAWLAETEIPADLSWYGTFAIMRDRAQSQCRSIVESAAATVADGSPGRNGGRRRIGALYSSFMDTEGLERLGPAAVSADLAQIAAITSREQFMHLLGRLGRWGVEGPLAVRVDIDDAHSDTYIMFVSQAGLGLPDPSYYRQPQYSQIREAYLAHIGRVLALAGRPDPEGSARRILDLETRLAAQQWDQTRNRDAEGTYNRMDWSAFADLWRGIDVAGWFVAAGGPREALTEVVVQQPSYVENLAGLLASTPLSTWQQWLEWAVLRHACPYLSSDFVDESFAFQGEILTGTRQQRERWKRGIALVQELLGEELGELYVTRHFSPESRDRAEELVKNLVQAYRESIGALEWMSAGTKKHALDKLAHLSWKIGHPDRWRDYSALSMEPGDLLGNVRRAVAFEKDRQFAQLGRPVDRQEWLDTPQTVDAYYNHTLNEIVFPAAILSPPLFSLEADDAQNYGGIGAMIGHEIGHGFDDQGCKYDSQGNLRDWWTEADRREFGRLTSRLVDQYDDIRPPETPGAHINGELTLGENIGDLGGLAIAHKAYLLSVDSAQDPDLSRSGSQLLFTSWARMWCSKFRPAELARRMVIDLHAPSRYRCNQVARNLLEFHQAFGVKPGDGMWLEPDQRVRIW